MTKLAPPRFVGQVMGLWFLALALGNNLAGQLSGEYDAANLGSLPGLFPKICGLHPHYDNCSAGRSGDRWRGPHEAPSRLSYTFADVRR
jgi:hypothetical protein